MFFGSMQGASRLVAAGVAESDEIFMSNRPCCK